MGTSPKELKYRAVYSAVLELLNSGHGLAGVNHSTLERMRRVGPIGQIVRESFRQYSKRLAKAYKRVYGRLIITQQYY